MFIAALEAAENALKLFILALSSIVRKRISGSRERGVLNTPKRTEIRCLISDYWKGVN